ncbi:Fibroblast growth factor receptor-like 1 [Cichlidogyrus casuarinus]|uniref:Fibroblast growth factor receptor-like 1 n=1 Tax=Cichlidogyrus casuarinus TaxID=1844966 RepID=A0ABD2Q7X9_9PLAT
MSDQGSYTCHGVTGHQKKKFTFQVKIIGVFKMLFRNPAPRKCVGSKEARLCFDDTNKEKYPQVSIKKSIGESVQLECEAFGVEPITYTWKVDGNLADWADVGGNARQPVLTVDPLERQHEGRYECFVRSPSLPGQQLHYTYEIMVEDPRETYPLILSKMDNQTVDAQHSVAIVATVQCKCKNPIIFRLLGPRLKFYNFPTNMADRPQQPNDKFILFDTEHAPIFVEEEGVSSNSPKNDQLDKFAPTGWNSHRNARTQTFETRLKLVAPLDKDIHAGKYMVITMASNFAVDSIDFQFFYINIGKAAWSKTTQGIVVYFLVPFGLLCCFVMLMVYCVICRKRKGGYNGNFLGSRMTDQSQALENPWLGYSKMKQLGGGSNNGNTGLNQHYVNSYGQPSPPKWVDSSYSGGSNPSQQNATMQKNDLGQSIVSPLPPPPNYPPPNTATLMQIRAPNPHTVYLDSSSLYEQNLYTSVSADESIPSNSHLIHFKKS